MKKSKRIKWLKINQQEILKYLFNIIVMKNFTAQ